MERLVLATDAEYKKRIAVADRYTEFCLSSKVEFIYSPQAFWIKCDKEASEVEQKLLYYCVETKPYYRPIFDSLNVDIGSKILEKCGLCLPTWGMTEEQVLYTIKMLSKVFNN
jgi:hypothetical protein